MLSDSRNNKTACTVFRTSRFSQAPLAFSDALPVDEAVNIIDEKCGKACDHRHTARIVACSDYPKNDQHNIVGGISKSIISTSACGEIGCKKACSYRNRAEKKACISECLQNEIKDCGNSCGKKKHHPFLQTAQPCNDDLLGSLIRIPEPVDCGNNSNRRRHSEIGYHFAVVTLLKGYDSVKNGKKNRKHLTDYIALGNKNQRRNADKRGCKSQTVRLTEKKKCCRYRNNGYYPERQLKFAQIVKRVFQGYSSKKISTRRHIFKDLTICGECIALFYPVAVTILLLVL